MTVDTDNIKHKAADILKLGVMMDPREFMTAIGVAAGTCVACCWPPEKHEECFSTLDAQVRTTAAGTSTKEASNDLP